MDFLLGADVQGDSSDSLDEWICHHQERLRTAHDITKQNLERAAEQRKRLHDTKVRDPGLSEGQLVYLKDHRNRGRNKIQDVWAPELYKVVRASSEGGVYIVAPADGVGEV